MRSVIFISMLALLSLTRDFKLRCASYFAGLLLSVIMRTIHQWMSVNKTVKYPTVRHLIVALSRVRDLDR